MRLRKRVLSSPRRNRTKRVPRMAYGHVTTRVHEHDNRTHATLTPPSLFTGTRLFYDATSPPSIPIVLYGITYLYD